MPDQPPPMPQPGPGRMPPAMPPGMPGMPPMGGPGAPTPMKMPVPQPMGKFPPPGALGAVPVGAVHPAGHPPVMPGAPGMPQEPHYHPAVGFWQEPWVQNLLPLVTSVVLHVGLILILGLGILGATGQLPTLKLKEEEQTIIPEATLAESGPPGGVPNVGPNNDPFRQAMQDVVPDAGTPEGWSQKEGPQLKLENTGGGSGSEEGANVIGLGAGTLGGAGRGVGSGRGDGTGSGSGDGSGPLAMFGAPGGGAIGPKGPVFGNGGNARKIAFICDATGTMINKFALLRAELTKAISGLKPVQAFNVVFFYDGPKAASVDNLDSLLVATPDNKRKAYKFMEDFSTTGQTDPLPGIRLAFKMQPQLIYFLSDGEFNNLVPYEQVIAEIDKLNKDRKTRINTIQFGKYDKQAEEVLQKIASDHGGTYRFVSEEDLTAQ